MTEDRKPEELEEAAVETDAPVAQAGPDADPAEAEASASGAEASGESDASGAEADPAEAEASASGAEAAGNEAFASGDEAGADAEAGAPAPGAPDAEAADAADAAAAPGEEPELQEMGLLGHLEELRVRLTRVAIAVVVGACASYAFAEYLYRFIVDPLMPFVSGGHLIYTSPAEGFITYIKLAAVAGVFLTSPYSFYQMWAFIAPGLYKEEKRYIAPLAFVSAVLFVGGALFSYYKVTPLAYAFFASFDNEFMVMLPSVKESLSMGLKLLFAFGIAFELPLVIFFLARLGVVSSAGLRRNRKYAILGAFIVGALLTPPDPASQSLMAIPLIILYEIGIWLAHYFGKKPAPAEDEEAAA
ncbi:twin-arginine translocase subunit TatC [Desulfocurvus vexinensis]|uniref:twin-arginine translocase subunit TatC n=1 Tax=Desulfocurvus vexinensis TaxID=399548 RepID=UPI0004AD0FAC|nr:twin-arginine translocase subunit TatC [Desulfocurvus vexinensis]